MRIGVDATSWTNRRGFGRFTRNVVPRLIGADAENEYVLYVDRETATVEDLPPDARIRAVALSESPTVAAAAGSSRRIVDLIRLSRAVRADDLDAFLFPSVYTYFPVVATPTVVGVHDAIVHELPHLTFGSLRDRLAWRSKESFALRTATAVFTVSSASRRALAERFGLDPEKVAVVPEAADEVFFARPKAEIEAARTHVGLHSHEPYLVFAGGISPHKNVETLVRAFDAARRTRSVPRLVLVGDMTSDSFLSSATAVRELIRDRGLEDHVLLPGYVDDDTLAALYSGATAVVIPSLAEGFGLPAVEGAACRAPLVLSDLPAHRETLDGAALFFSPRDDAELVRALLKLLDHPAEAEAMAARACARASELTWDDAVEPLRRLVVEAAATRTRR
ncbi:MAG TPA: glycosyltransferase family 1 protein [Gaiellaceae bacterium]|nr:glycosyltransferase family 1 protein [Gaiellaceae bacterium]